MTLHEEQHRVQQAMNTALSGLQADPWLTRRILANKEGEEPMTKKISVSMILVIALIVLSITAALAAGLGLFGQLAQDFSWDSRLPSLEETAQPLALSVTTEDGITVEIPQAYYEGDRVFISYRLSGNFSSAQLHEGAPGQDYAWNDVLDSFIAAENFSSDLPEHQAMFECLDGKGQRWAECAEAGLHDGLSLEDGTYLEIYAGDIAVQPDGSIIGWKECRIPEDRLSDTLTIKARLYRVRQVYFQDGSTLKRYVERGETTRNDSLTRLTGSSENSVYTARAALESGNIDLRGTITLTCPPAWVSMMQAWEGDVIWDWHLYQNGQLVAEYGADGCGPAGENRLVYELLYPRMESLDGLTLVPWYSDSGEHPDEAIRLERIDP